MASTSSSTARTLVATEDLFIGRFRAHRKGDAVPESNVERNGWADKVARPTTQAAQAAQAAAAGDGDTSSR